MLFLGKEINDEILKNETPMGEDYLTNVGKTSRRKNVKRNIIKIDKSIH